MPRRKPAAPEQGDGVIWAGFVANAQGIEPGELLEREHLAGELVEGRLDLPSWLSGRS
jgi:hypothetical protein